jgi:hypothetical protein
LEPLDLRPMAVGVEEVLKTLGRAPGAPLSSLQEARAGVAYRKMWAGSAQPGELWAILSGQKDDELLLPKEFQHRSAPRVRCKDCSSDISLPGSRKKSDPARCVECFRKKKHRENQAYRNRGFLEGTS